MTAHPYPQTVVEAVAKALWDTAPASAVIDWEDIQPEDTRNRRSDYLEKAHAALSALWEASRVDTWEELESVPQFASVKAVRHVTPNTARGLLSGGRLAHDLPAHVLYWGDPQ